MSSKLFKLLKRYTEVPGPVGHETLVAEMIEEDWVGVCERVWKTKVGNVVAKVGGKGPKLLITAHMDEINLLVKSITEEGFLWVTQGTGGSEANVKPNPAFLGQPALVKGRNGYHDGILTSARGHVLTPKQRAQGILEWDAFFVDLGLSSRKEVEALGIRPGQPVIYNVETRQLGEHIIGKAMDDRLGLAIMTLLAHELQEQDMQYEVYFAATIQEEVGLVGAASLGGEVEFDLAVALEIGLVGDIPTVDQSHMPTGLGKGPIIAHKDAGIYYSESVAELLEKAAEDTGHTVQHAVFHGFGSDGIQLIKEGVPTALFTFPTRYTHSPYEMVNEKDIVAMIDILKHMILTA